ncbi:hypothetical protein K445DRAFT_310945 [Daldinia sp. EC12]|nr:hypothetical protein K445DRAFT_310945 [Daldinia sp. EC12]
MGLYCSIFTTIKLAFAAWFLVWLSRLIYSLMVYSFIWEGAYIPLETSQFIEDQRRVANFDFLDDSKLQNRLIARAIPNQRLVKVFGIDNSFTTTNINTHRRFYRNVGRALHGKRAEDWPRFFTAASTALNLILAQFAGARDSLPLAVLTRELVFLTTLYSFFEVNIENVSLHDVRVATNAINDMWVHSKTIAQPDILQERQRELNAALLRMLPNEFPCSAATHPMNIILPAYETMWRIVLLTFISAGFRDVDQETADQFREVIQGVPECFEDGNSDNVAAMAMNFSKEGLRLYPPTKRIYRAFLDGPQMIADIQKCHRDPDIWPNPEQFRPSRFLPGEFTADMERAYLPFSIKPHKCPAADKFAPHAIIILVVVLAKSLGTLESGATVRFRNDTLDRDRSALLPSGRLDTEDWTLQMKDTSV